MSLPPLKPFAAYLPPGRARAAPWLSVMAGSLVATAPFGATLGLLPPCGLLMLLAWRLLAPLALRRWAPVPLGLFDDLVSGQPPGSAMLLWMLALFLVDLFDQRTMYRDFWQDWLIAAAALTLCLVGGRLVATPLTAHVDAILLIQIAASVFLFPLAARIVAWIDRKRAAE